MGLCAWIVMYHIFFLERATQSMPEKQLLGKTEHKSKIV